MILHQLNLKPIEEFIKINNLSKTQFCKKCGISVQALNNLSGRTRVTILFKILEFTKIKCDDILKIKH